MYDMVRSSRAVSEILAGVILFTVVTLISLAIFFYAIFYVDYAKALTEYGYAVSMFNNIAEAIITRFTNNTAMDFTYPHEAVSIGYSYRDVNLSIILRDAGNNSLIWSLNITRCYVLRAGVPRPVVTSSTPVKLRGDNITVVNDINTVPLIYEYYSNGWSILVLDLCRIYYSIKSLNNTRMLEVWLFNLTGVNGEDIPPMVTGQGHIVVLPRVRDIVFSNVKATITPLDQTVTSGFPAVFTTVVIRFVNIGVLIG
ncbi:hypothetical protein DKAM_0165 [Desulfurococcus amylolyticus 1221n]|uniref:Uncharacterized protein n=2 Tax=Desulfurococcus amylolyticus TaxID=94694 RepID=B8D2U8_DESA1|nr:hypothetical protein DKAM_0165 [Desulfurococcus amylolyticus 1221n]